MPAGFRRFHSSGNRVYQALSPSVGWRTLVSRGIWKGVSFGVPGEQIVANHRSFLLKAHSEHFRKIMQAEPRSLKILPFPI